ncbi:hypothetical protein BpHYR1_048802 [Brachionus plicatilis]|uniref:Uncharacterized protein n=1 Tax=Brachionus plicatilis TaxID=10195 RepID=A0A3M7RJG5_BRAPC|nr:hypothetical protein BpHYR1_048802 [Brachionus plicatilis]
MKEKKFSTIFKQYFIFLFLLMDATNKKYQKKYCNIVQQSMLHYVAFQNGPIVKCPLMTP